MENWQEEYENECKRLLEYLKTDEAKAIMAKAHRRSMEGFKISAFQCALIRNVSTIKKDIYLAAVKNSNYKRLQFIEAWRPYNRINSIFTNFSAN